ncbi:putative bifunctional diguanylate cyclase/phosphodiesterase [Qipengyuania sediminis]|uniref:putative bifunctional diguanylate cyclase/phosphodiesterase n=1 Tax=Qipengyuania sediminis TaxID=1532023 RepID=UPI001404F851|nr:bifunctional diguanylate cyclase/phosphodiesterase [Qipengyuania sediminis]
MATTRAPDHANLRRLTLQRRLGAFAAASPLALAPTLASIMVVVSIYAPPAPAVLVTVWCAAALALLAARVVIGMGLVPGSEDTNLLERQWRRVNTVLVMGSLAWALSLPLIASAAPRDDTVAFAVIGAVLFSSVLLLHRCAPTAAIIHILAMACGLTVTIAVALGPRAWPLAILVALYSITLILAVRAQDRSFISACTTELERQASERRVDALLSEHEAQTADWRWTIDGAGALHSVSDRLARQFDAAPAMLEGQALDDLLEPGPDRDTLAAMLQARQGFRDIPARIRRADELRLLAISGQPTPGGGMAGWGRDVTAPSHMEERVRALAQSDPQTGLANRAMFTQHLVEVLAAAQPAALLSIDVDDFRAINDHHGHLVGDIVLRDIAERLCHEARDGDMVARLGLDAFVVLIEAPGGDGMLIERAHRLLAAIREPLVVDGQPVQLSAGVGIARANGGCAAEELLRRSELALHAAKEKGRDQIALFDEGMDRRARERRTLERELREAISGEQMVLHYQPIVSLESGAVVGYEALLRWQHPARGLLPPDRFLGIAEETGLMAQIGDWVIGRALAETADWRGDFRLAVNLSASQVRHPLLVPTIDTALARSGFPARRLEFEITEHTLFNDGVMLERLRRLGAEIALDDFGTGYSSLSYLRRFKFDRVKIDRSFVTDIETSAEAQAIVAAITRLAAALGMRTTAEGVETPGQLDLLRKLGCDEAQGFLILEPLPAREIEARRALGAGPALADHI